MKDPNKTEIDLKKDLDRVLKSTNTLTTAQLKAIDNLSKLSFQKDKTGYQQAYKELIETITHCQDQTEFNQHKDNCPVLLPQSGRFIYNHPLKFFKYNDMNLANQSYFYVSSMSGKNPTEEYSTVCNACQVKFYPLANNKLAISYKQLPLFSYGTETYLDIIDFSTHTRKTFTFPRNLKIKHLGSDEPSEFEEKRNYGYTELNYEITGIYELNNNNLAIEFEHGAISKLNPETEEVEDIYGSSHQKFFNRQSYTKEHIAYPIGSILETPSGDLITYSNDHISSIDEPPIKAHLANIDSLKLILDDTGTCIDIMAITYLDDNKTIKTQSIFDLKEFKSLKDKLLKSKNPQSKPEKPLITIFKEAYITGLIKLFKNSEVNDLKNYIKLDDLKTQVNGKNLQEIIKPNQQYDPKAIDILQNMNILTKDPESSVVSLTEYAKKKEPDFATDFTDYKKYVQFKYKNKDPRLHDFINRYADHLWDKHWIDIRRFQILMDQLEHNVTWEKIFSAAMSNKNDPNPTLKILQDMKILNKDKMLSLNLAEIDFSKKDSDSELKKAYNKTGNLELFKFHYGKHLDNTFFGQSNLLGRNGFNDLNWNKIIKHALARSNRSRTILIKMGLLNHDLTLTGKGAADTDFKNAYDKLLAKEPIHEISTKKNL